MQIGYSEQTLLLNIIKQAQEIMSESRWIEYYSHCAVNNTTINCVADCVCNIEDCLKAIKENLENLREKSYE